MEKFVGSLWAVGGFFCVVVYLTLPTITLEMEAAHEWKQAGGLTPEYMEALDAYAEAQELVDEAKVWFWKLREPSRTLVDERQVIADEWVIDINKIQRRRDRKLKLAEVYDTIQTGRFTNQDMILVYLVSFTILSPLITFFLWSCVAPYRYQNNLYQTLFSISVTVFVGIISIMLSYASAI